MAETPLADRVTILETKMEQVNFFIAQFDKVLEVRLRAQAEMLDERFAQVDRRFVDLLRQIDSRFVDVVEEMREGIATILQRLS